jgi:hypothetical protein
VNFSEGEEMAFTDRSQVVRKQDRGAAYRITVLFAGTLAGALTATVGLRLALPADALAPVIATLLFALAAAAAGLAFLCRRNHIRTAWFDIAGSLTFVGVAVSILIEPDQVVRLLTLSEQSE